MPSNRSAPGLFSNLYSFSKAISFIVLPIGGAVLIGYGYGWLVEDFIVSDMVYVYAAIPTLFTIIGMIKIIHGPGGKRIDKRAIQNALANRPPENGEVYAFMGTLEADDEVLSAPFSGKDCILYEYSLSKWVHGGRQQSSYKDVWFSGFHMCPAHINTTLGPIALHLYPTASGFVSNVAMAQPLKQSARHFAEHTSFEDAHGLNYVTQVGESFAHLTEDIEPPVAIDLSFTQGGDLDSLDIDEEYVPPGIEVCLIARYDAKRRAAVPYAGAAMSALDRALLKRRARDSWIRGVMWGLVFLSVGLGIGLLPLGPSALLNNLGSPGASMLEFREKHLWSAIREDSMPFPWHLVSILEPDARDEQGRTLLMSAAVDPKMTRVLLERGADPNAVDSYGETALQKAHKLNVAKILLEYGANASVLTGGYAARLFFTALNDLDTRGVSLFLQNGLSPEYLSAESSYPLNVVVAQCDRDTEGRAIDLARMLLEKGARVDVRDASGSTALEFANHNCGRKMVDLLSGTEAKSID